MNPVTIDIGKEYSRYPAGRHRKDGPFSGERFRDELLLPALRRGSKVEVVLDGTAGYGSSFLEESFGGLMRAGLSLDLIRSNLVLVTEDPTLSEEIWLYISDEAKRRRNG